MRLLAAMIGFVVMVAVGTAHAQGLRFARDGCEPSYCSESDWIFDDNFTDHTTTWRHRLRGVPRFVSVMFTPDPENGPVIPLIWPWYANATNPVSMEMDNRTVRLQIHTRAPLMSLWRPPGEWTHFTEGYWKIVVYR